MKIITGSTGKKHITSNNDGEFNQGIFGSGLIVLGNGEQLDATIVDNNTIRIKDGDIVMQGRHALIEPGNVEDITISTGSVGNNRIDLIVARYQMDVVTGYESITLEVLEGEESSGEAIAPQYTTGVIRTGSLIAEHPLYQVNIEGINITNITKLFNVTEDLLGRIQKNEKEIAQTNSNLTPKLLYAFQDSDIANSDYVDTVSGGFYKTGHIITIIATIKTKETTITGPVWFVNTAKNFVPPKPLDWTNNDTNGAYIENTCASLFQFQYHYF